MSNTRIGIALIDRGNNNYDWGFVVYLNSNLSPHGTAPLFQHYYDNQAQAYRVSGGPVNLAQIFGIVEVASVADNLYNTIVATVRSYSPDEHNYNPSGRAWGSAAWVIRTLQQLRQLVPFQLRWADSEIHGHIMNNLVPLLHGKRAANRFPLVPFSNGT
ncbi:unnamed protein product [Cyclocybe aegerita]|uniref:Uncharacterized protein n=1 Tax=Cyclocybe aegerita TaxID=1973307 RepID=A0A8S0WHD5_CYCAE|nr:unnamed protein product [Cyclocybe aegerita]